MTRTFWITFRTWPSLGRCWRPLGASASPRNAEYLGGAVETSPVVSISSGCGRGQQLNSQKTAYEGELERIDEAIARIAGGAPAVSVDAERETKSVYLRYQRASLTGNLKELADVEVLLNDAIRKCGPAGDLCFLKANLDFKFHRLADVKRDLETGRDLRNSFLGRTLLADLDFQEGRYDAARQGYEAAITENLTWDNLARLGYLKYTLGDFAGADQCYIDAENELTAKELRHYAWVELQRGVLDLRSGQWEKARAHYKVAELAYSGYWLVDEHIAELLGAQGKYDEAIAIYESVVESVPRPEFQQALGELYLAMGRSDSSETWNQRALTAYLESVQSGEVHYYHHLTDFYSDVREDGAEAVKWARKDIALRRNASTVAALAWALYRAGEFSEALDAIKESLSSGATNAQLFYKAGMIHQSAAQNGLARDFLRKASELNPHYRNFHVHR
jgi:tetratricopeptide (TPR) repeat protein